MSVDELLARFPEIPKDLRDEPLLAEFAASFAELLRAATRPSNCSTSHDAANRYYLKLVGPTTIYGYGLATRESLLRDLGELLERQRADPEGFAESLLA